MASNSKSNSTSINVRWGNLEDDALVKSLLKLIEVGGWRAENGQLKSGAYGKVEKIMKEILPGCDMKARPHIESRVRTLRKQFFAIEEMPGPNCSGFGWNDSKKSISCEKGIFDDWLKFHPGKNVGLGKDHTIFSLIDGLVKFEKFGPDRKQISVYPRVVVPENPNSYRAKKRESFRVQRERRKARKEARLSEPQLILASATETTADEPNC